MSHTLFFVLCIAAVTHANPVQFAGTQYHCEQFGSHCFLNDVVITKEERDFEIVATSPEFIRSISFRNSHIEALTSVFCKTFPGIEVLELQNLGLEELEPTSFSGCTQLLSLDLSQNSIPSLPENLFDDMPHLRYLYLADNKIQKMTDSQFVKNAELRFLYLTNNSIEVFPASAVRGLDNLLGLNLAVNEMSDIDEIAIIANLKMLQYIQINHNELSCTRINEILERFKEAGVNVFADGVQRDRYYEQWKVGEFTCLRDKVWTSVYFRKLNHKQEVEELDVSHLGSELELLENIVQKIKAEIK